MPDGSQDKAVSAGGPPSVTGGDLFFRFPLKPTGRKDEKGDEDQTRPRPAFPEETAMVRYEYRHVRMAYHLASIFSKTAFDRQLSAILEEMGRDGWDLKSSVHELGALHIHLIFGRQAEDQ